jgi:hypothetical protein
MYLLILNFCLLEFRLLLRRVTLTIQFFIMNLMYLFDESIGIKISFFGISVTIEARSNYYTVHYHELFDCFINQISLKRLQYGNTKVFNRQGVSRCEN